MHAIFHKFCEERIIPRLHMFPISGVFKFYPKFSIFFLKKDHDLKKYISNRKMVLSDRLAQFKDGSIYVFRPEEILFQILDFFLKSL